MKENKQGAILLIVLGSLGAITSYLTFFIFKPLEGTQERIALPIGMAVSSICVIAGIILLVVISMLKNQIISKDEKETLAAITKERKQKQFREESIRNNLKCPECRRHNVEWNFDRESFCCLWRDCNWEAKEYEDPGMTKEEKKTAERLSKILIKKG